MPWNQIKPKYKLEMLYNSRILVKLFKPKQQLAVVFSLYTNPIKKDINLSLLVQLWVKKKHSSLFTLGTATSRGEGKPQDLN